MPLKGSKSLRSKGDVKMEFGIWLGAKLRTDEVLVGTEKGVVKTRTIKGLPEEQCWDKDYIMKICGTPKEPVPGRHGDHIPIEIDGQVAERATEDITQEDIGDSEVHRNEAR